MVLFGGDDGGAYSNDTWLLNGSSWALVPIAPTPDARSGHAMAYDAAHQNTVLFGGVDGSNPGPRDTWIWDGARWTQANPASSPGPRVSPDGFDPGHNNVLLWGGEAPWRRRPDRHVDLGRNQLDTGVSREFPPPRYMFGMAYDNVRKSVVIFGGFTLPAFGALNDMWEWTGTNWNQITPAVLPSARPGLGMASDTARNRIVLFGGLNFSGPGYLNDTWEWDGSAWSNVTPSNPALSPPGMDRFAIAYYT